MHILNLNPIIDLYSIKVGLKARLSTDSSIAVYPVRTVAKFRELAMGYINMEEMRETKRVEDQQANPYPKGNEPH